MYINSCAMSPNHVPRSGQTRTLFFYKSDALGTHRIECSDGLACVSNVGATRHSRDLPRSLVGRAEISITRIEATAAIAALALFHYLRLDVGPAMPAFFCLALMAVAVKSLSPNFPHAPLV